MNIFLEDRVELNENTPIRDTIYSRDPDSQLMAIIRDREISFLNNKLENVGTPYSSITRIKVASWSPADLKIAIGHENGLISFYDPFTRELREESEAHDSEIIRIDFSPSGKLMLTQDKNFNVIFWKDINPIKEHCQGAPLNVVIFVNFLHERKDKIKKNVKLCFIGDKMGSINYFEEKRLEVQELCKINGSIKELFYYSKTNSVIVVTSTYYLIQFKISTEEDIVPDKKIKISMENTSEHLMGLWIEPNTFMLNSKDPILKFWNVETGNNYSIDISKVLPSENEKGRIKVQQMTYDQIQGHINILLSNSKMIIICHKKHGFINDSADWSFKESPNISSLPDVIKIVNTCQDRTTVLCKASVHSFNNFKLKLFIDSSRNLKFLLKSNTQIEYFEFPNKDVKKIDFSEPFTDLLVTDQTLVIVNKEREIFTSTVFELIGNGGRLNPIAATGDYSYGLKKFNKLYVTQSSPEVFISRYGYLSIVNDFRILFVNYKSSVSTDFCHPDSDVSFTDLIFNNQSDHFVVIDEDRKIRIFQTTSSTFRLLYDYQEFDVVTGKKEVKTDELKQDLFSDCGFNQHNTILKTHTRPKIELLALSDSGDKLLLLLERPTDNLMFINAQKRTHYSITLPDLKSVERVVFSKTDNRFFSVVSRIPSEGNSLSVAIYVLDDDKFCLFDAIKTKSTQYFLELNFPEVYLSSIDEKNEIKLEIVYCQLFKRLLLENEQNQVLKVFTRNFCFNLVLKKLSKALTDLKKIEKSFDLEDFWISLFNKSLDIKNLKMAELCLSKIKFVRGKLFSDIQTTGDFCDNTNSNDSEKLGNLCLCFNNIDQAKKIFMEEKNYFKITEILFLEENYDALLKFCSNFDKSLLNYYYFKIAINFLKLRNYSEFLAICKKAKILDQFIIKMLDVENDHDFLEKLSDSEGSSRANHLLAKFHHENQNLVEARRYLDRSPENKSELIEFVLKTEGNFESAKGMSISTGNELSSSSVNLILADHKKNLGDVLGAVEQLLKGQHYIKVIKCLQSYEDVFAKNEDFKIKIVDIIYNHVIQNSQHYAAGAFANYLISIEVYEKACLVYMKAGDFVKAQWVASTYNLNHLLKTVETTFASNLKQVEVQNEKSVKNDTLKKNPSKSVLSKEFHISSMIENGEIDDAISTLKSKMAEIRLEKDDIEKIKKVSTEKRVELLRLAAKNCQKQGKIDEAIDLYSEAKDNVKVLKTMIKAKMIPRIIQFANFSRNENIFVLAANSLQNFQIEFKDATYTAILNLYTKAKKYSNAIDFLRNFSVELFEKGCVGECFESVEKAQKLTVKLKEDEALGYCEVLKDDFDFLSDFMTGAQAEQSQQFIEAFRIYDSLYSKRKSSLYSNCQKILEKCFLNAFRGNEIDKLKEISLIMSRNESKMREILGEKDFAIYQKMIPVTKNEPDEDQDMIDEDLE